MSPINLGPHIPGGTPAGTVAQVISPQSGQPTRCRRSSVTIGVDRGADRPFDGGSDPGRAYGEAVGRSAGNARGSDRQGGCVGVSNVRSEPLCPGCPPRFLPDGGLPPGRADRSAGLSLDGGLLEFDEFSSSRARSSSFSVRSCATSARSRSLSASSALTILRRSATSSSSFAILRSRSSGTPIVEQIQIPLSIPYVASDRIDPGIRARATIVVSTWRASFWVS